MHGSHLEPVDPSYFSGVALNGFPGYDFGWILQSHYASAEPGGAPVQTQDYRIFRYTRITVCATVHAGGWNWYLVGPNMWVQQTKVGLAKPVAPPAGVGSRWVAVDLYEQVLTAYEGGKMVFATLISSGLPGWDTNPGVFQVYGRQINAPMSGAEGRDDAYRLENVPYAMYFDNEISLHGTYWHNGFGYRQSHGCVNLTVSDAAWLWNWLGNGSVYVYYSGSY
jgi:lipoprotein-anchoring transpeptidase ErfK/SrfK